MTNSIFYGNGQAAITEIGGSLQTNIVTGNWSVQTNGTLTLGPTNSAATITAPGSSGNIAALSFSGSGSGVTNYIVPLEGACTGQSISTATKYLSPTGAASGGACPPGRF